MGDIKTVLVKEMEAYFGEDARRIRHAARVTQYAEELLEQEGGERQIVLGAAVLHDIGIHEAERKHGSTAGRYQELEGPPIARQILVRLDFEQEQIEEICDIIAHHHSPAKETTLNFAVLYDADWLVNLQDEYHVRDRKKLARVIDKVMLTRSGRELARKLYLDENA